MGAARGNMRDCLNWTRGLKKTLAELDALPRKLSAAIADPITAKLQDGFARGVDPYGQPWRPLVTGQKSRLTKTSRLRRGTKAAPMGGNRAGLKIVVGRMGRRGRNPIVHMTGTRNMPARKFLPDHGMPASWRAIIKREHAKLMKQARVA